MDESETHPSKALNPILLTLEGRMKSFIDEQP
jgi:hypothetical protein